MEVIYERDKMREWVEAKQGQAPDFKLALVPTMGYLHEGHLTLIREARRIATHAAVSIFVNPLQFNDPKDYEAYPVNIERDLDICRKEGVGVAFAPSREQMLGTGSPALQLSMPQLTRGLCGPYRPGHFEGVLLIVARLLCLFQPRFALFGKKDFQQLTILRRMVQDLDIPVQIIGVDTVREDDGLAMSSRNVRLDPKAREHAGLIPRALKMGLKAAMRPENSPGDVKEIVKDIVESGTLNRVEYVDIVDPISLLDVDSFELEKRFLIATAVYVNGVRLIDNMEYEPQE